MNKHFWIIEGQINKHEWMPASPAYELKKTAQEVRKTMRKDLKYRIIKYIREEKP